MAWKKQAFVEKATLLVKSILDNIETGIEEAPRGSFDPRNYAAKWDGVTDDTVAIQQACEAAETANGTLWIPEGIGLTKGLVLGKAGLEEINKGRRLVIRGPGTLKLFKATTLVTSSAGDVITNKTFKANAIAAVGGVGTGELETGVHHLIIEGIKIDGNKAENATGGQGGCGIRIYGYNYVLTDLDIRNCKEWPLVSEHPGANSDGGAMESRIIGVKGHESGNGIYYNGPHDSVFNNCWSYGNATGSIGFDCGAKANGVELVNCHPWAFDEEPLKYGAVLRGSGQKVLGGQYEGHYTKPWKEKKARIIGELVGSKGLTYEVIKTATLAEDVEPPNVTFYKLAAAKAGCGIRVMAEGCQLVGVFVYNTGENQRTGRGIQFGSDTENLKGEAGTQTIGAVMVHAAISFCLDGPLDFQTSRIGHSVIKASCYCPGQPAYIGSDPSGNSNILEVYNNAENEGGTLSLMKLWPGTRAAINTAPASAAALAIELNTLFKGWGLTK